MAYAFAKSDADIRSGLIRIAEERIDHAVAELDDDAGDLSERVHEARKDIKKLRGLIRLVRPAFPSYARENIHLRDAGRLLSAFRDRGAAIETLDGLVSAAPDAVDQDAAALLRTQLTDALRAAEAEPTLPDRIASTRRALVQTRDRLGDWTLEADGVDAFGHGLARTLRRARHAFAATGDSRDPATLHEWRKRVKYHWYHARLLKQIWPPMMQPHIDAADDLADALGTHRDLVGFEARLHDPATPDRARRALVRPLNGRLHQLEMQIFALGPRLMAERPKSLVRRWGAWWTVWRAEP